MINFLQYISDTIIPGNFSFSVSMDGINTGSSSYRATLLQYQLTRYEYFITLRRYGPLWTR